MPSWHCTDADAYFSVPVDAPLVEVCPWHGDVGCIEPDDLIGAADEH